MERKKKYREGRVCSRLSLDERRCIEHKLDSTQSIRSIVKELGHSPSSVSRETERHRIIVASKAMCAEPILDKGAHKKMYVLAFLVSPYCCNGCRRKTIRTLLTFIFCVKSA